MTQNTASSPSAVSSARTSLPAIGVIGLGIMGGLYAQHLLAAGFTVTGYDVSAERIESFRQAGGQVAASPTEVVERADIVVVALSSISAFHSVLLDADSAAAHARPDQIFIETGTIPIALKMQMCDHLARHGAKAIDAPVTGTRLHAERKELVVYASGEDADFERVRTVIEAFASDVRFVGAFGTGMKLKIITNLLVAVHTGAAAEALSLAKTAGLDLQMVYDLINGGPAGSSVFGFRGPLMIENRFKEPTMRVDVFSKDVEIIGNFARTLGAATPLFDASSLLYHKALEDGMKAEDISAVFNVLIHSSGHRHQNA